MVEPTDELQPEILLALHPKLSKKIESGRGIMLSADELNVFRPKLLYQPGTFSLRRRAGRSNLEIIWYDIDRRPERSVSADTSDLRQAFLEACSSRRRRPKAKDLPEALADNR